MNDFEIQNGVLIKYHGHEKHVVIPDTVTSIRNCAFMKHINYTECILPNGIESVSVPESVTRAGTDALYGCNELKTLTVYQDSFEIAEFLNSRPETVLESEVSVSREIVSNTADKILNLLINQEFMPVYGLYMSHHCEYEIIFKILSCKTKNQKFLNMVREHLPEIFSYLLTESKSANKAEIVQSLLNADVFTEEMILSSVQLTNQMQAYEIQLMLTNYLYQHFDFKNKNNLKL